MPRYLFLASLLLLAACSGTIKSHATGGEFALATAHPLATQAGIEILQQGGNAFDAAVAVSAALAVVEPYSSGIGGGGFWLLHPSNAEQDIMLDGRERAPLAATRDMYLDEEGNAVSALSINGSLAAGIPGVPAALEYLAQHYGRLDLATSLQPAIRLATDGFPVDEHYRRLAAFRLEALRASPDAAAIFLHNNEVPQAGYVIKQPDLAKTLQRMAQQGANGFYSGETAEKMVAAVKQAGGIWSSDDLDQYTVKLREPLQGSFKGMKITSVAPPSSGGVALIEMFNILNDYALDKLPAAQRTHYIVEAMRRAYRDRAEYLGDSDFIHVPIRQLTSPDYAAGLRASIHPQRATPSDMLPGFRHTPQARHTTHYSIVDAEGNRVAATLSINYPFGSCFVAAGTGVLLNDEMDDFSAKPGVPNAYGLVGAEANAIAPGKRMLSSMSPTFLETDERLAVIGTPGGSRIITMVLLGALAFHDGVDAQGIVDLPRFHHQYLPDRLFYEAGAFDDAQVTQLQQQGYTLQASDNTWGNMQVVIQDKHTGELSAASDKRGVGEAQVMSVNKGQ